MKRFGILWVGIFLSVITLVLTVTPLHILLQARIQGRMPLETYPELFWMMTMPFAWLIVLVGAVWAKYYKVHTTRRN